MTILLTGSSGKTSSRLAALLTPSHQILIASRSGASVNDIPAVKFDWNDPSTYTNPYSHPQAQKSPIKAIYLVTRTGSTDPIVEMKPFIDIARERGVKRFVLLSTIREDENTPGKGKVHKYLKELEVEKGVEWTVLRPTWFMENFSELHHAPTIRDQSAIFSATRDGRISFISVSDIAAVASRALTDTRPHNCDYILVGPELLSYDQVAALFSEVLGREIKYVRVTEEQVAESYIRFEVPEDYARKLGGGEGLAAKGVFEVLNDVVEKVKGAKAVSLREFVEANKAVW